MLKQLSELIEDLWWCSESDQLWELERWDTLDKLNLEDAETVDIDRFFSKAIQSKSWYGKEENREVKQYQALIEWLKTNLTELKIYRIGEVNIDIYVVGKSSNNEWIVLHTVAVET